MAEAMSPLAVLGQLEVGRERGLVIVLRQGQTAEGGLGERLQSNQAPGDPARCLVN